MPNLPFRRAVFASMLSVSAAAIAEPVKRDMPACISEEALDELITYASKGDTDGHMRLMRSGKCVMLRQGQTVSVVSPGFMRATIRLNGTKLYTPAEALR